MESRRDWSRFLIAFAFVVLGVLALLSPLVRFNLKYWVSYLFVSRSDFKVYLVCFGLPALLLLPKTRESNLRVHLWSTVLAGTLYLLALSEQLYLHHLSGFRLYELLTIYSDGTASGSLLHHSHTGKGALARLVQDLLGDVSNYNYEFGMGFLGHFPEHLFRIHYALYIALIVLLALNGRPHKDERFWVHFIFSLVSLSVIKGVLDGGILWPENLLSFLIFLSFGSLRAKDSSEVSFVKALLGAVTIVALLTGLTSWLLKESYSGLFVTSLESITGYLVIFGILYSVENRKLLHLVGACIFTVTSLYYLSGMRSSSFQLKAPFQTIHKDEVVRFVIPKRTFNKETSSFGEVVNQHEFGKLVLVELRASRDFQVYEMEAFGVNPNFYEYQVMDKGCRSDETYSYARKVWHRTEHSKEWKEALNSAQSHFLAIFTQEKNELNLIRIYHEPCNANMMESFLEALHVHDAPPLIMSDKFDYKALPISEKRELESQAMSLNR